jgi:hypothetical protein
MRALEVLDRVVDTVLKYRPPKKKKKKGIKKQKEKKQ